MKQRQKEMHLYSDVLVVGGGMAGMFAAIKSKEQGADVILTDKNYVGRSGGTHYAEGDIQFFRFENGDDMEAWLDIVSKSSEYVNNTDWNRIVFSEVKDRYEDLISWGIKFYEENGQLLMGGPHVFRGTRPVYKIISMRNREYAPSIRHHAMEAGVRIYDRLMICELLKQDGKIVGAVGFNTTSGKVYIIHAKATIIATGAGTAYKVRAMNTDYWTGDGECMAYRVGAEISGKEFRQANVPGDRNMMKKRSELYDGSEIKGKIDDTAAKYPFITIQSGWFWPILNAENEPTIDGGAWDAHTGKLPLYYDMDGMSPALRVHHEEYFRRVGTAEPDKINVDFLGKGKMVYPSARVQLNSAVGGAGLWPQNEYCASNIPGLFAAGASCATMTSGSRYGGMGMGLSGGMVTGTRAAKGACDYAFNCEQTEVDEKIIKTAVESMTAPINRTGGFSPAWVTQVLQGTVVPYYISLVKNEERLNAAITLVEFMEKQLLPQIKAHDPHEWRMAIETKNMVLDALMQLRASLFRTESRGSHYREDYPRRGGTEWLAWVKLINEDGQMKLFKEPIPERLWPDLTKPYEELYPYPFPLEDEVCKEPGAAAAEATCSFPLEDEAGKEAAERI